MQTKEEKNQHNQLWESLVLSSQHKAQPSDNFNPELETRSFSKVMEWPVTHHHCLCGTGAVTIANIDKEGLMASVATFCQ